MSISQRSVRRAYYRIVFLFALVFLLRSNNKKEKQSFKGRSNLQSNQESHFQHVGLTQLEKDEIALALGEYDLIKDRAALDHEMQRLHEESMRIMEEDAAVWGKAKLSSDLIKEILLRDNLVQGGKGGHTAVKKALDHLLGHHINETVMKTAAHDWLNDRNPINTPIQKTLSKDRILTLLDQHDNDIKELENLQELKLKHERHLENKLKREDKLMAEFGDRMDALEKHKLDVAGMKQILLDAGIIFHPHHTTAHNSHPQKSNALPQPHKHHDNIHTSHDLIHSFMEDHGHDFKMKSEKELMKQAKAMGKKHEPKAVTAQRLHQLRKIQESEKFLHMDMDLMFNTPSHKIKDNQKLTTDQLKRILSMGAAHNSSEDERSQLPTAEKLSLENMELRNLNRKIKYTETEDNSWKTSDNQIYVDRWIHKFKSFPYVSLHSHKMKDYQDSDYDLNLRAAMINTKLCHNLLYEFRDNLNIFKNEYKGEHFSQDPMKKHHGHPKHPQLFQVCPTVDLQARTKKHGYVRVLENITPDDELLHIVKNKKKLHNPNSVIGDHMTSRDEHTIDTTLNKLWKDLVDCGRGTCSRKITLLYLNIAKATTHFY